MDLRLSYHFIIEEDREGYRDIITDGEVTIPAGYYPARSEEDFERIFSLMLANKAVTICLKDEVIGYMDLYPEQLEEDLSKKCVGIGFAFKKQYWHQGFGYEMLSYFSDYLKTKVDYIICDAFVENEASNALIKKCGFSYKEDYTEFFKGLDSYKTCHSYIK